MPLSDHLSMPVPLQGKDHPGLEGGRVDSVGEGFIKALSRPLPFGPQVRDCLSVLLICAALAWFWHPLTVLYSLTQRQEHYSHIVLIPWLSLYAFYLDRRTIFASREWSPTIGLMTIGLGAMGYWFAESATSTTDQLPAIILALVVICWGVFLLSYGIRSCRTAAFGLLFLLFMVPLPSAVLNAVIVLLQRSSAEVTEVIFSMLGVPVFREGFVFSLSNFTIHVAEECSGIRSTLSLCITSIVAGHFFLRSAWAKAGLVLMVVPLAIVKNAFRIVGLSLLANYVDPSFITDSALHRYGGIPLFLVSLVVLFSLVWTLRRFEKRLGYYPPENMRPKC